MISNKQYLLISGVETAEKENLSFLEHEMLDTSDIAPHVSQFGLDVSSVARFLNEVAVELDGRGVKVFIGESGGYIDQEKVNTFFKGDRFYFCEISSETLVRVVAIKEEFLKAFDCLEVDDISDNAQ